MPPSASKANYKTYEAQARMVRAIVAAHPEVKWNFKGKRFNVYLHHVQSHTQNTGILGRLHCSPNSSIYSFHSLLDSEVDGVVQKLSHATAQI